MHNLIDKYLKNDFGELNLPNDNAEKQKLARELLGFSIVKRLDNWLDSARDLVENDKPKEPFIRDNAFSRKDREFRGTFSKLDAETKEAILKLVNSTATGIVFSILTNFDEFDFGEITLSLKPKAIDKTAIEISSKKNDLHNELSEWIYSFSKFKDDLVAKEENKLGISFRLK